MNDPPKTATQAILRLEQIAKNYQRWDNTREIIEMMHRTETELLQYIRNKVPERVMKFYEDKQEGHRRMYRL